jgi:hypothetical protein
MQVESTSALSCDTAWQAVNRNLAVYTNEAQFMNVPVLLLLKPVISSASWALAGPCHSAHQCPTCCCAAWCVEHCHYRTAAGAGPLIVEGTAA